MKHKNTAWDVKITDKNEGSFTIGYWVGSKSEAKSEAKFQYPNHDKYEAITHK